MLHATIPANGRPVGETKRRILDFIAAYQAEHGWAPSLDEITTGVGLASKSSVHLHLRDLQATGQLVLGGGPRMIRLTNGEITVRSETPVETEEGEA